MRTALKVVLAIVGILVVLVVAAVVIVPLAFNPNDYKGQIAHLVQARTGRDVRIPGQIKLSVFPWLGVDLGKVELSNAKGFGPKPFASIDHASVHLRVWPLVYEKIELGKLALDGLTLRLTRNKQGQNNWSGIEKKISSESAHQAPGKSAPQSSPATSSGGFSATSFQAAGLQVKNAQIYWKDAAADTQYRLEDFSFRTGKVAPDKPFPVNASFDVKSSRPQMDAHVTLAGTANADLATKKYSLRSLHISVAASGAALPGGKQTVSLTGDAAADLGAQTLALQHLEFKGAGLDAHAKLEGRQIMAAPHFTGTMTMDRFSPRDVMKALGLTAPRTRDANALTQASLSSNFKATKDSVALSKLDIALDSSHLTGTVSVKHFSAPAIDFDLAVDQFDADRYLPPSAEAKKGAANPKTGKSDVKTTPISLGSLKGPNVAGTLAVGKLTAMNLQMQKARVKLKLNKGVLNVDPLAADLYGGKVRSSATVNAQGNQRYTLSTNVSGVKAGPLLKDMTGKKPLIDGLGRMKLDLQSSGRTVGAVRGALAGNGNFEFSNGAINGFNLAQIVRNAKAKLTGQSSAQGSVPQKTDFTALTGSVKIDKGVLHNHDLSMKSPLFRVGGDGTVNLVKNTLDYEVKASVVDSLSGQGGAELSSLKGVTVPIRLGGHLLAPSYHVDIAGLLGNLHNQRLDKAKQQLKAAEKKQRDKLSNGLSDKLKHFLQ